jgi:hypothetical protein
MQTIDNAIQAAISAVIHLYFNGAYEGNADMLKQAFHPNAHITGILQGKYYEWTREEFIARVTQTPTAATKNEVYDKKIIYLDQQQDAAMVKAQVVAGNYAFTDYITLLKINDQWIIKNKSFVA